MLHLFLTDYFLREHSYTTYEFFNYELAKWAEYYLGQKTAVHQAHWCTGRVTESPNDILLGHPTWDNPEQAAITGLGSFRRNWVKDNALTPKDICHPNTYIIMPWVPEFPIEWRPNLIHLDSQLQAARKIFALCSPLWIERTIAKADDTIHSQVSHKLIQTNIGIATQNLPIVKQRFNPVGQRQLLHVSTLGSYKGFENTCESLKGLNARLNVASKSLHASVGLIDATINGKTYTFNFLGSINNADPNFNQWVVDTCDFYIHTSTMDAQATAILENAARGLIPLVTPESGFECPHAIYLTHDPDENRQIIDRALNLPESELLQRSQLVRQHILEAHNWESIFNKVWHEIQTDIESRSNVPITTSLNRLDSTTNLAKAPGDYISPNLVCVYPDEHFPNMIAGNTNDCNWLYLRREIPHNWYVDKRQPSAGFLNRDEAHILYNNALQFKGKRALEIGCWMGWSACHLALAGLELDVIDPLLANPQVFDSVSDSLKSAGVEASVNLVPGCSPEKVQELANQTQRKWSFVFIDGNHDAPAPRNDAIAAAQLVEDDAMIMFHDLASPDVAQGLDYLRENGWNTMVYQTMQIMGVAWRGNVQPIKHQPDPRVNWHLPNHLQHYFVSSTPSFQDLEEFKEILDSIKLYTMVSEACLFNLYSLTKNICLNNIPGNFVECGTCMGGSAALMAVLVKRYSRIPRFIYAFDTFEGMPDPTEVDRHEGVPANDTGLGAGTLKAPVEQYLNRVCHALNVSDIVIPVKGLFKETLPKYKSEIGDIALLHADADWYESTMDIFSEFYDRVVSNGAVQIDDYGYWEGCRQAVHDFERRNDEYFTLYRINYTGVFFYKHEVASLQHLNLQDVNFILFPDWSVASEHLCAELHDVLKAVLTRSDSDRIALLVDASNTDPEIADEAIAEVVMNLLMQPDIEFEREPKISLITDLSPLQWQHLLPRVKARIELEYEDPNTVIAAAGLNIPVCGIEEFSN